MTPSRSRLPFAFAALAAVAVLGVPAAVRAQQPTGNLQYFGGEVIPNVKVVAVLWGTRIPADVTSRLQSYLSNVTASAYMDVLAEYNTPTQQIGHGTYVTTFTDTKVPTSRGLGFNDIPAELEARVTDHSLPTPDANTLYVVYMPRDTSVTVDGLGISCQDYGGYHDYYNRPNGTIAFYAVIPDCSPPAPESDISAACWPSQVTWEATSHEITESVTDPVPLGGSSAFTGWLDPGGVHGGEIADICFDPGPTFTAGVPVAQLWSNSANMCIAQPTPPASDFSLDVMFRTGTLALEIDTQIVSGSSLPLTMTACGLPAGVTASFSPATVQSGQNTTVTFAAAAGYTNRQFFSPRFYATSGSVTRLSGDTYLDDDTYTMTVSPATKSITAGQSATYTVTAALASGTAHPATLSILDAPCIDATFNPPTLSPGGSSTLTLATGAGCNGDYTLSVIGTIDGMQFVFANDVMLDVTGALDGGVASPPDAAVAHPDAAVAHADAAPGSPDAGTAHADAGAAHPDAATGTVIDANSGPAPGQTTSSGCSIATSRLPAGPTGVLAGLAVSFLAFVTRRARRRRF